MRDSMESVATCVDEVRERLVVAMLRPDHKIGVHATPLAEPGQSVLLQRMASDTARVAQKSGGVPASLDVFTPVGPRSRT
jgi:hypothetical protein